MNIINLLKLADYLDTVHSGFDMEDYCIVKGHGPRSVGPQNIPECGTVACAIGHGPKAGIPVPDDCESWHDYSESAFGLEHFGVEWAWCFSGDWVHVDNTPLGAAKRIRLLVNGGGIPENARMQRKGYDPLSY